MTTAGNNIFNEAQYAHLKQTLPPEQYEAFINYQRDRPEYEAYKTADRLVGRKKAAGQNFFVRRQSLVLRRVNQEDVAPDEDVLAYEDIYRLKRARHEADRTYEEKMKIPVTDEEINAFRGLEEEGHFYKDITLEMIEAKMKGAGDEEVATEEEIPEEWPAEE